jgi:hypothetical protein
MSAKEMPLVVLKIKDVVSAITELILWWAQV